MKCRHTPRATINMLKQPRHISEWTEMMFLSMIHKRQAETVSLQTPAAYKVCPVEAFRRGINSHLSLSLAMLQFCLDAYLFSPRGFTTKNTSGLLLATMGRRQYGISQMCSYHMPFTCLHFLTMVWAQAQSNLEPCKLNTTLLVQLKLVGEPENTENAQSTVS